MDVYIYSVILVIVIFAVFRHKQKYALKCFGFLIFLISVLRSTSVGWDYPTYINYFEEIGQSNWSDIFLVNIRFEPGYVVFNKLIYCISDNYLFFTLVVSAFNVFSTILFIKRYSKIYWLSCFLFLTMGFFNFQINILRQSIAMSIAFYAYYYADHKMFKKFLVSILLAASFHYSSFALLFLYPLFGIQLNYKKICLEAFIVVVGLFVLGKTIIAIVSSFWSVPYDANEGTGFGMLAMLVLITVCGLFLIKIGHKQIPVLPTQLMVCACCFQLLSPSFSMFVRFVQYFSIGAIIFLPSCLKSVKYDQLLYFLSMLFICIITMFYYVNIVLELNMDGTVPYKSIL